MDTGKFAGVVKCAKTGEFAGRRLFVTQLNVDV